MNEGGQILTELYALQDLEYKAFHSKLIPEVPEENIIGIRVSVLRHYAKTIFQRPDTAAFIRTLPHRYYEENNLHALLLEQYTEYDTLMTELERFLPYVDNWATCDMITSRLFKTHTEELLGPIQNWLSSEHTYTVRFGVEMLMKWYLDAAFRPEYPEWVGQIRSEEYYVKMAVAWYFATALAKQYDAVLPYLEGRKLERWTHNKTIQKAVESYRIAPEQKEYLKTLKTK